ncbi:MAG: nucleotidyltransferase domain-containing protein [Alphaproteobacteria bacterium]|nr:nucleotidyltransferase domain-containing protein [Alphaproteobacteria bacterium]
MIKAGDKNALAPFPPLPGISAALVHPALADLVARLGELGADRVILYGSRARGDHMPRADIDLAVDVPGGLDVRAWDAMMQAVENAQTLLEIDLVCLQETTGRVRENILKDGKVLNDNR